MKEVVQQRGKPRLTFGGKAVMQLPSQFIRI